jgi:hypothetical protein
MDSDYYLTLIAIELEALANQIRKGERLLNDDADDLDMYAGKLRLLVEHKED